MIGLFRKLDLIPTFVVILLFTCCTDDGEENKYTNHHSDGDVQIVLENDPDNGINVIFMGDAYTKSNLEKETGKYDIHAMNNIEAFFNKPPFSEYKEHFNAYIIYAESEDDQTSTSETVTNTKFGSMLSVNDPTGLDILIIPDDMIINEYVRLVTSRPRSNRDIILMSVNNADRGSAKTNRNLAVSGNGNTRVMLHEIGHAFSGLADEYFFDENVTSDNGNIGPDNLDTIDDLNFIKWSHFVGLEGYSHVRAFEGGGYYRLGIWRPENNSIMKTLSDPHFNAPSRESIVKKIMSLRNLEFDFEKFLEIDRRSMTNKNSKHHQEQSSMIELNFDCDPYHNKPNNFYQKRQN